MAQPESLALPPSARLVHIGPHKTGTTSVQSAFHIHRAQLRHHGVHYAGSGRQPAAAALAVAGGSGARGDRAPRPQDWTRLLEEIRRAGQQRVVVSSEYFAHADDAAARRVVGDLQAGPGPVHVVVTLRPLTLIAPSQWQQFIQNGRGVSFDKWLARTFPDPPSSEKEKLFWHRHSHGQLVRRWADAIGPENLTVIVTDGGAPDALMRTFEAMLALPEGLLEPEQSSANRSLSQGEVELVRHINRGFRTHDWSGAWSSATYDRLVYRGAVLQMKTGRHPASDEPRVRMPEWVMDRVCRAGRDAAEAIASQDVRVVGDLSALSRRPSASSGDPTRGPRVRADAVVLAVLGVMAPRERDGSAARRLAALSLLEAIRAEGDQVDSSGMPLLTPATAARAVLAVIGGGGSASLARDGELVAADLAELAVLGACAAAGRAPGTDLTPVRPVLEALGVDVEGSTDSAQGTQITGAAIPLDKKTVENVTTRRLVEVVAQRVTRRVRLRWRHGRGGSSSRTRSKR